MTDEAQAGRIAHLRSKPWNYKGLPIPPDVFSVPGMLSLPEKRMLYYLTRHEYSEQGLIADMGSYLGGSTICFATALRERGIEERVIHSYDLFRLAEFENEATRRHFPGDPPPDLKTRAVFEEHLKDYLELIEIHEGDVLDHAWSRGPIEILFIDIAKTYRIFDHLLLNYFPALVPSMSLVVMQDYLWGSTGPWHHVVMEKLSDYFEYVVDTDINSAVFLTKQAISRELLDECQWMSITMEEKLALMDRAIEKLDTEAKKEKLKENKELLLSGRDLTWGRHYHDGR